MIQFKIANGRKNNEHVAVPQQYQKYISSNLKKLTNGGISILNLEDKVLDGTRKGRRNKMSYKLQVTKIYSVFR